jgi:hypothetical protein
MSELLEFPTDTLGRAILLTQYFADSPNGWCGEGNEIAQELLPVLRGEPIDEHWTVHMQNAYEKGWRPGYYERLWKSKGATPSQENP